jgi:RNA polymerase sigma-70 factor (ECF subfamily)
VAVTLVRKYDQYDPSRPFGAWAIGIGKYEVLYFRRERATDRHLFDDDLVEQIASRYELLAEDVDPLREALKHCVEELKGRSKRIIDLRYRNGMRANVIAQQMTLTPGAVRSLLARIREQLRRCIQRRIGKQEKFSAN